MSKEEYFTISRAACKRILHDIEKVKSAMLKIDEALFKIDREIEELYLEGESDVHTDHSTERWGDSSSDEIEGADPFS